LVHAADISNPARPLRFCRQWGHKVHEEFFAQGEQRALFSLASWLRGGHGTECLPA
jgi:hypothetical protein